MCPTRELVIQTENELQKLLENVEDITYASVYGGTLIEREASKLRKSPNIIIGTTGRIMEHILRKNIYFENTNLIVLDEADQMLDMGFRRDIDKIIGAVKKDINVWTFSATMNENILELSKKYQSEDRIYINNVTKDVMIDEYYINVDESKKQDVLINILDNENTKLVIIFANTKAKVDLLKDKIEYKGYLIKALYGEMNQKQRKNIMDMFVNGKIDILVTTDLSSRGLNIQNVNLVINYDLPLEEEVYVHRIGRTGRFKEVR